MVDLRHFLATRLRTGDKTPVLVVVDEFPQLVTTDSDPGDAAAALLETARSAGAGLILAAQSTAGLSNDDTRRARALASGAALIVGRSKDPDLIVRYAGTAMRLESTGTGDQLNSGRAQHALLIPPQDVREAWDGSFWLIQGGAIAPFRSMPPARPTSAPHPAAQLLLPTSSASAPGSAAIPPPAPADQAVPSPSPNAQSRRRPMTRITPPTTFIPPSRHAIADVRTAAPPIKAADPVTGIAIEATPTPSGGWAAVAYPTTDRLILDDLPDLDRITLPIPARPVEAQLWEWQPNKYPSWNASGSAAPDEWKALLDDLLKRARRRNRL
jgi:hypothetical protein